LVRGDSLGDMLASLGAADSTAAAAGHAGSGAAADSEAAAVGTAGPAAAAAADDDDGLFGDFVASAAAAPVTAAVSAEGAPSLLD
jgi:hypothetical protein